MNCARCLAQPQCDHGFCNCRQCVIVQSRIRKLCGFRDGISPVKPGRLVFTNEVKWRLRLPLQPESRRPQTIRPLVENAAVGSAIHALISLNPISSEAK
jgi:hypothetical protein